MTMPKLFVETEMRYTRTTPGGQKEHRQIVGITRNGDPILEQWEIELDNGDLIEITVEYSGIR